MPHVIDHSPGRHRQEAACEAFSGGFVRKRLIRLGDLRSSAVSLADAMVAGPVSR
ncbi:hypothetical protein OIE13_11430 [Streptosporangium sp. NBC_01810]|uniref:hypothetical protein n=1 Tax=Streptosporangium sp. NBC_01810 TaxID=2975951 RepID=UPI002DDC199F|nr:hypothetical protein [Streptosporangium sp. NBC_01810]WSA28427.1 hypothetical protein OIE13_11430 [Streptosporangium sp. NBC_01810]